MTNEKSNLSEHPRVSNTVLVSFTVAELWLLNDFIRHDMPERDKWGWPPVSEDLNDEIANALHACDKLNLEEYYLPLSRGDLFTIDFFVRRDHKTPEGALGKKILLKTFEARSNLSLLANGYDEISSEAEYIPNEKGE